MVRSASWPYLLALFTDSRDDKKRFWQAPPVASNEERDAGNPRPVSHPTSGRSTPTCLGSYHNQAVLRMLIDMGPVKARQVRGRVLRASVLALLTCAATGVGSTQGQSRPGVRGDPAAIADAQSMVAAMGGVEIWRELQSLHFVHEWDIFNRPDVYLENEILDLTGPRSYVTMKSEIYDRVRAYSPEYGFWNIVNGQFSYETEEALANALERAPYSIYRLARAVARGDSTYHVQFGPMPDMLGARALEFRGPDDVIHGWILLNTRKEPVVWATTQYVYAFGPLERYGNVRVPKWAITGGGRVRYEMVTLTGSRERPDSSLFMPPAEHAGHS